MTFLPPEWKCLRAAMPRLELLYDLPLLLSAHLVEVQTNLLLPTMHTVSIMRTAASEAMPLRQAIPGLIESEVERSYVRVMNRRQSDSEDRSKSNRLDIKQGRHLIRQALQFFELLACNGGVKGQGPLRSLGGPRGIFSHVREYPPYPQPHTVWGKAAASSGCPPPRTRGEKEDFSFEKPSLFTYFLLCRSNYSASCIAFAAATAFACASAEHCS